MKKRKSGGGAEPKPYNAQGSEVEKEAEERKAGGAVKRKSGGGVQQRAEGGAAAKRHDRPGRKRGGGVGSDMRPLSSAANTKDAMGHKAESGNADELD